MPHTELMDPNAETERGNHLAIYQECLYEFRESAEFIAFVDWDDFFVPLRQSTLIAAFRRQARLYPNAGAYRVSRRHTMFLCKFEESMHPVGIVQPTEDRST